MWKCQPKVWRTNGSQRNKIVALPTCHLHPQPRGCHPNTKYCLEIRVMLTEELGAILPPSHSWTAPLVEDMLCKSRTGLTKAVVIGPGRVVLFYGRHSMGEGLRAEEARDAAFLLTGAGTWVGKSAYLTTNQMTIHEGRRAIAQAVSDNRVKVSPCESAGPPTLLFQPPKKFSSKGYAERWWLWLFPFTLQAI